MYSKQHRNPKNSANSSDKAFTSQFAPRGFVVQPKTEAATSQQEQTPDLESQGEEAKQYKSAFIDASKFTPRSSPVVIPRVQMKLTIGEPGDQYEQEADRMAADVVQRINAPQSESVQRVELPENEDELQMKPLSGAIQRVELPENEDELQMKPMVQRFSVEGGTAATPDIEESIQSARGSGQPLGESIREPMEQAFGADFSGVKVHTDTQSDQLNQSIQAKAFTTGQDVFFRGGEYNPGSQQGQELIAHELTHVVQQNNSVQGLSKKGALQRADTVVQRATYDQIKPMAGIKAETEARLAQIVQVTGMTPGDDIGTIFNKLVSYGHQNFSYESGGNTLSNALAQNTFNCETISDLLIVICLLVKNENIAISKQILSPNPILYRGNLAGGGFKGQVPNAVGTQYLVYSGGHTGASVGGALYDVTTGVVGGLNADYIVGRTLGNQRYSFNIDGNDTVMRRGDNIIGGLWEMTIEERVP